MKKNNVLLLVLILSVVLSVYYVSAYQKICLGYGQSLPDGSDPIYTCFHDSCQVCTTDSLFPTAPYRCNGIPGCITIGEGGGLDVDPPIFEVNSPLQGEVYDSRRVLFDLSTNEPASYTWIDNINGRGRWRTLSSNKQSYVRSLSFKDGLNNITLKAKDRKGNVIEIAREFYVDSKAPRLKRTEPRKGFANGDFSASFVESNPKNLVLHYGNSQTGYRTFQLDIANDCNLGKKGSYNCNTNVDIDDYDGESIEYYFILADIADTSKSSKVVTLDVDVSFPILNNPSSFWEQDDEKDRYIYFNLSVDETNLDSIEYIDYSERRPRYRKLCTRLDDEGICEKRKSFRRGNHQVALQITDEAGNAISTETISFSVS